MTEDSPFAAFHEATPLNDLPEDSVDEFLQRITEDLVAGVPEKITDERITALVALYRKQAEDWVTKQVNKPARRTKAEAKKLVAEALDLDIQL